VPLRDDSLVEAWKMMKESHWLLEHKFDKYTQTGEDGIIQKALEILPLNDKYCVEFGAWDGLYLSNVRKLIEQDDYKAVMIEGDPDRFVQLKENYHSNTNVTPINKFVGFEPNNGLDSILDQNEIPQNFDFLSIDIDGNDYYTWNSIEYFRPKLICIEFNPTIPTEVDFVQEPDPEVTQGCSLSALVRLGKKKGYELISVLPFNAFFVDKKYFDLFEIQDNSPHTLRKDLSCITWMFSGYDGSIHLSGSKKLLWHGVDMTENDVQVLPKKLQTYPCLYTKVQKKLFSYYEKWRNFRYSKAG